MRILANYGYKNNGDTYSVTFETIGDVPKEQAHDVVDELFHMAKAAIQRQLHYEGGQGPAVVPVKKEMPQPEEAVVSGPKRAARPEDKPRIKDPDAPASKKQKNLIIRLARETGKFVENLNLMTMQEASETIDDLRALSA